jgi:hypothetical protein
VDENLSLNKLSNFLQRLTSTRVDVLHRLQQMRRLAIAFSIAVGVLSLQCRRSFRGNMLILRV